MPQRLTMPSERELPPGPRRQFVEEVWLHWRSARRPTLREVEDGVGDLEDCRGAVSREQFRRMLKGLTIPGNWDNAEAVLLFLCARAGTDPDSDRWPDDEDRRFHPFVSYRTEFFQRWNDALDAPPAAPAPPTSPWDDEPPF